MSLNIQADSAAVVVLTPAGGKLSEQNGRLVIDGVVVDYRLHNRSIGRLPVALSPPLSQRHFFD